MRSVPSTMESVTTLPLLLDNIACSDPSPAREECSVSLRWPSTRRAGLVLPFSSKGTQDSENNARGEQHFHFTFGTYNNAHLTPDRNAATTMPPESSLATLHSPLPILVTAISTDSKITATPLTGSSHNGPARIAN